MKSILYILLALVVSLSSMTSQAVVMTSNVGIASWYGHPYHGRRTASGELYDQNAMTAAHPSIRFGTLVTVTDIKSGRQVTVRINDRGPFVAGRIVDLSYRAAQELGIDKQGLAKVRLGLVV